MEKAAFCAAAAAAVQAAIGLEEVTSANSSTSCRVVGHYSVRPHESVERTSRLHVSARGSGYYMTGRVIGRCRMAHMTGAI